MAVAAFGPILRLAMMASIVFVPSYACPVPCECITETNTIDCSDRGLTDVPEFLVIPIPRIELLDLSRNELTYLNASDFGNLIGLLIETIDVSFNRIDRVIGDFHNGYEKAIGFRAMNLSNNLLETFPRNVVPNDHSRAELIIDISNNLLEELPSRMFDDADDYYPGFQFIVHSNQIKEIQADAFAGPTISDAIIDFRNNSLESIPEGFKLPIGVRSIMMADNPWSCDCTLRWISKTLFRNYSVASPPFCNSPGGVEGRPLFSLSNKEYACAPTANATEVRIPSSFGVNHLLDCPVTSDPPDPSTVWKVIYPDGTGSPFAIEVIATQLNVTNAKSDDVIYRCTASNQAGSVSVELRLDLTTSGDGGGGNGNTGTSQPGSEQEFSYVTEIFEEIVTFMEKDDSSGTRNRPDSRSPSDLCVARSSFVIGLILILIIVFFIVSTVVCIACFWRWVIPRERKRQFNVRTRTERADFSFVSPGFFNEELDNEDDTSSAYLEHSSTAL